MITVANLFTQQQCTLMRARLDHRAASGRIASHSGLFGTSLVLLPGRTRLFPEEAKSCIRRLASCQVPLHQHLDSEDTKEYAPLTPQETGLRRPLTISKRDNKCLIK